MKFIEMPGATLRKLVNSEEMPEETLAAAGVEDTSIVRVNHHGDIEIRRPDSWDVIGGLVGDFHQRVQAATGLNWI